MGWSRSRTMVSLAVAGLALVACMASSLPVARANDTSLGAIGGTVYPIRSTQVRLDAETVQATCFGDFVEYRVDFRFVNAGAARMVRLGLPFDYSDNPDFGADRPVGFQAWQDGEPLEVRAVPADFEVPVAKSGYFVHRARFPHGVTMITVSYLTQYSGSARGRRAGEQSNEPGFGMASWCEYWLHTGATWKGRIGEAVVRYRFAESFDGVGVDLTAAEADKTVQVTAPEGWTAPLARAVQWHFREFEPVLDSDAEWWQPASDYDVMLGFGAPIKSGKGGGTWAWSSVASDGDPDYETYGGIQDGDLGTCWAEGIPGTGEGEWVEARFKKPRHLRELRILPGNNAYLAAFTKYARPKALKAVFSDGSSALLRFRDAPALHRFPVDVTTSSVRLVVESVYPGTDYPGTCIAEVEFGTDAAPGYATFVDLMADDGATGRLPSWAGPAAPAPRSRANPADPREAGDAEAVACGDLIGLEVYNPFPADRAPFTEPAALEDVTRHNSGIAHLDEELVGKPVEVNALSTWTYAIRYDSGIDLLVNTAVRRVPYTSVVDDLAEQAHYGWPYRDGRRLPYDVQCIGECVVGVAPPGTIEEECACPGESNVVPGQVFWRRGDISYHLYARNDDVTIDRLVEVATSLIDPRLLQKAEAEDARETRTARGWLVTLAALAVAAVAIGLVVRRRKAAAPPAD